MFVDAAIRRPIQVFSEREAPMETRVIGSAYGIAIGRFGGQEKQLLGMREHVGRLNGHSGSHLYNERRYDQL